MEPRELVLKGSDKVIAYGCGKCDLFYRFQDKELAERCCDRHCEDCNVALTPGAPYYICCSPCRNKRQSARDQETYNKAKKIPASEYKGEWVFCEGIPGHRDGYFSSVEELLDHCEQEGLDIPADVYVCDEVKLSLSAESLIENALEEAYEDAGDDITNEQGKELQDFLDAWCAKTGIVWYTANYSTALILEPPECSTP